MATSSTDRRPGRLRVVVALLFFLLGLAAVGTVPEAEYESVATDSLAAGSDSAKAAELAEKLPSKDTSAAVVLFSSDSKLSGPQIGALRAKAAELAGSDKAPFIPAEDGTAVTVPVTIDSVESLQVKNKVIDLREKAKEGLPDGVEAQVTGPAAIQADLAQVFAGADVKLLAFTATIVAILLIVTYRSPVLWLVPIAVVGVADRLAAITATHVLSLFGVPWDASTTGILSVLVFGAGTDYALLIISRYRDELRRHEDRHEAMAITVRRTAEPVLTSSSTVFLGLATLLLSVFPATRGLGLACAVGIAVAAFFALVVLPGVLVMFPRGIFWPRRPKVGDPNATESDTIWHKVGARVAKAPAVVASTAILLLLAGCIGLGFIKTGLGPADQFLDTPESIAASQRLGESFPAGSSNPLTVITTSGDMREVMSIAKGTDGVASVNPTNTGAGLAQLQVILEAKPGSDESLAKVEELRSALDAVPETYVGGGDADRIDEGEGTSRDRVVILPLVLLLVTVGIIAILRSLVAPLVLVATTVLTFATALGLSWWVFTGILGFDRLDAGAPLTVFVFLVALGVDYTIFLVTRAKEEAGVHGTHDGMLRALTATGGVITSAGILLAAVFAVLGVLPLVVLAQVGVVICIGVLLDTLVVRTVVVPALALILGDKFWWPRKIGRREDTSPEPVKA